MAISNNFQKILAIFLAILTPFVGDLKKNLLVTLALREVQAAATADLILKQPAWVKCICVSTKH